METKKESKITYKLLFIFTSALLVFIIVFGIIYFRALKYINNDQSKSTLAITSDVKQQLIKNCNYVDNAITDINSNKVVKEYFQEDNPKKISSLENQVYNFLMKYKNERKDITDIILLKKNGQCYSINGESDDVFNIGNMFKGKSEIYYSSLTTSTNPYVPDYFVAGKEIYKTNSQNESSSIGSVAVLVSPSFLGFDSLLSLYSNTKIYFLDRSNNIFMTNDAIRIGSQVYNPENMSNISTLTLDKTAEGYKYTISDEKLPYIDGKVISVIPTISFSSQIMNIQTILLILFFFIILLFIGVLLIVFKTVLKPVEKKASNAERAQIQSEIACLQYQVNPHFLYNTLESIKGIASTKNAYGIVDMVDALGTIFRYSVKGNDLVMLQDEINIIKSFILIQNIRFMDKFNVSYEFDEAVLDCLVPKMILQPLVENSIFHGLERIIGKGELCVGAKSYDNRDIEIWVRDNGVGMESLKLQKICESISRESNNTIVNEYESLGIGIANLNRRIKLVFGDEYGISITSTLGRGTDILLRIPIRRSINV